MSISWVARSLPFLAATGGFRWAGMAAGPDPGAASALAGREESGDQAAEAVTEAVISASRIRTRVRPAGRRRRVSHHSWPS